MQDWAVEPIIFAMQEGVSNANINAVDMPACTECRRRKLRCSRDVPTCKECRRSGAACLYEQRDTKPGMKTGAVENLNRRVDHLESLISQLQQQVATVPPGNGGLNSQRSLIAGNGNPPTASDVLKAFEKELRRFNNQKLVHDGDHQNAQNASSASKEIHLDDHAPSAFNRERKRRRLSSTASTTWADRVFDLDSQIMKIDMSSGELLDSIIQAYFTQVHPWIPMVHKARFQQRLLVEPHETTLEILLHAMIVAAVRFVDLDLENNAEYILQITKRSRDFVLLSSLDNLCVENLQASIIVAFDDIGNGNAEKAWSVVGSLTRTVEYLQLSIESETVEDQPLLQPLHTLPAPQSWIEIEERRRVFWNVFNLDRFCSVVTGWNTSLTSDDVYRCLPADGVLWRKGEAVLTPYFGIWDKSAGRIGNSIAFLPTQYPSPTQIQDGMHHSPVTNASTEHSTEAPGISTIGAFAYCIEAVESMSQVTTYFLQQKINLRNQKQIESWLTRFKELDLRLVHWKLFLPQKWKDTKIVSQKSSEIIMDTNLTVAHVTHNASMILLHQLIAYPLADWGWAARLPSRSSANTCQAAAAEIAIISQNYLASPRASKIFNSQFVFCIFVAARSLLVHWRYYSDPAPLPEFSVMVDVLDQISICWHGQLRTLNSRSTSIATKYASQLSELYEYCLEYPTYQVDVLGYTNESTKGHRKGIRQLRPSNSNTVPQVPNDNQPRYTQNQHTASQTTNEPQPSQHVFSSPQRYPENIPPLPLPISRSSSYYYGQVPMNGRAGNLLPNSYPVPLTGTVMDSAQAPAIDDYNVDLNSISQIFFDQQYIEMDRVISFDDGMFNADWNYGVQMTPRSN